MPASRLPLRLVTLSFAAVLTVAAGTLARAQEAVFLVRHAERQDTSADSPLSPEGRARAERLAQMLRDARIAAIYVSEFQRTAQTAQPLADLLKLPLIKIPAEDTATLVSRLHASGPHARVLVVSHSDRLPTLLHDLGRAAAIEIPAGEYDDIFVVLPRSRPNAPAVIRLRY